MDMQISFPFLSRFNSNYFCPLRKNDYEIVLIDGQE